MNETKSTIDPTISAKSNGNGTNGVEGKVNFYKEAALNKINFSVILKPLSISFVALIISFFLDLSSVPILGNVTVDIAQYLFPTWKPIQESFAPYSFWWLPVFVFLFFVLMAFLAYNKLKVEISRTPASETIDRIINFLHQYSRRACHGTSINWCCNSFN